MNIVYATTAAVPYPSAASVNTVQMCESLVGLGHDVTLAVGRKLWRWPTTRFEFCRFFGFRPSFRIRRFPEFPRTGWWFDSAVVKLARRGESLVYLRYPRLLPRLARANVPAILEVHSSLGRRDREAVVCGFRAGTLLGMVAITESLKHHLLEFDELGPFSDRLLVAPDAVDPKRFRRARRGAESSNIGYVGSLYRGKGMERIFEVAQEMPDASFLIYGGRLREKLYWTAQCRKLRNVRLQGRVRPADIPDRMASFSIALLPNQPSVRLPNGDDIGEYTSPLKLFEYMAAGKAIIASDLPNLREVVTNGHNGLLVKHDDTQAWVGAIQELQSNTSLRNRLARQALADAELKYAYNVRFRRILTELVRPSTSSIGDRPMTEAA